MILISEHSFWALVFLVILIVNVFKRNKENLKKLALTLLCMGATDLFCYQVLKPNLERPRPCHTLEDVNLYEGRCGGAYGLPSNHSANGMAAVTAWYVLSGSKKLLLLFLVPLAVGISRMYLGVHYPGDAGLGFIVGALIALIIVYLLKKPMGFKVSQKSQK